MIWKELKDAQRLLIEATLRPVQSDRFQPTGFPDLGPAEFTAPDGTDMLLVESAQSMANRLEAVCWDEGADDVVRPLRGLAYVRVRLSDGRITNSILEAHRLDSPYIMKNKKGLSAFPELESFKKNPNDMKGLARAVFRYDPNSLIHGVFLENIAGGLRLKRALSAFIEARDVHVADSGGVKIDRMNPGGKMGDETEQGAEFGYGHVPYHRREFVAKVIKSYFNLDLGQIRSYGLGEKEEDLLTALSLYKVQGFLESGLRLRTACDLRCEGVVVTQPSGWRAPSRTDIEERLPSLIKACTGGFASPPITDLEWAAQKKGQKRGSQKEQEKEEEST